MKRKGLWIAAALCFGVSAGIVFCLLTERGRWRDYYWPPIERGGLAAYFQGGGRWVPGGAEEVLISDGTPIRGTPLKMVAGQWVPDEGVYITAGKDWQEFTDPVTEESIKPVELEVVRHELKPMGR